MKITKLLHKVFEPILQRTYNVFHFIFVVHLQTEGADLTGHNFLDTSFYLHICLAFSICFFMAERNFDRIFLQNLPFCVLKVFCISWTQFCISWSKTLVDSSECIQETPYTFISLIFWLKLQSPQPNVQTYQNYTRSQQKLGAMLVPSCCKKQ
jgi:hypothetical protein